MNDSNMSAIFAPCFFRCPFQDMTTMLEAGEKERAFVLELFKGLDTTGVEKLGVQFATEARIKRDFLGKQRQGSFELQQQQQQQQEKQVKENELKENIHQRLEDSLALPATTMSNQQDKPPTPLQKRTWAAGKATKTIRKGITSHKKHDEIAKSDDEANSSPAPKPDIGDHQTCQRLDEYKKIAI